MNANAPPGLLAVGEVLVDLIAEERSTPLADACTYRRVLGGSVANVAVAFSHLGGSSALAAAVGSGPFGDFAIAELQRHRVDTSCVVRREAEQTSVAFVAGGVATPEFAVHRGADALLEPTDLPAGTLAAAAAVHCSAFALSRDPARSAVLAALGSARARGALTSLDLNYHPAIWDGRPAEPTIARAVSLADHVKASGDDLRRLFGPGVGLAEAARLIHAWGGRSLVVTLGPDGAWYSDGDAAVRIDAAPAEVVDTTGAGDAFWAGFLYGRLHGHQVDAAVRLGAAVAARKVARLGPLDEDFIADDLLTVPGPA